MSLGQIKNVIESQGIEYPVKYKKDKIVGWSLAEIRKILSDPIYGDERYSAIVKKGLEIARRMLTLNKRVVRKRMEISALVGIAMCKECGGFFGRSWYQLEDGDIYIICAGRIKKEWDVRHIK